MSGNGKVSLSNFDRDIIAELGEPIAPINPGNTLDMKLNWRQWQFVQNKALYPAMLGAKGASKTWGMIFRCLFLLADTPVFGDMSGNIGWIGRYEWQAFKMTVLRELFRIIPRGWVKRYLKADRVFVFENGSQLICGHFDDLSPIQGMNLGFAAFSQIEQLDVDIWEQFQTNRVRLTTKLNGQPLNYRTCFGEGNPPGPAHWTYLWKLNEERKSEPDYDLRYALIHSKATDNREFLPIDHFENARRNLTPLKYRRDIEGSFEGLEGAVWEEWDEEVHCTGEGEKEVVPLPHWPKAISIDYGRSAGHGCSFLALNVDVWPHKLIHFDEAFIQQALITDHVQLIEEHIKQHLAERLQEHNVETPLAKYLREFHFARHDPSMNRLADTASARSGNTRVTIVELYREELSALGLHFGWLPADNDVDAGVERVAFLLRNGRLLVNRHCRHTRDQVASYLLDPKTAKPAAGQNDHQCDTLRYGATAFPLQLTAPRDRKNETVAERIMRLAKEDSQTNFAEVY